MHVRMQLCVLVVFARGCGRLCLAPYHQTMPLVFRTGSVSAKLCESCLVRCVRLVSFIFCQPSDWLPQWLPRSCAWHPNMTVLASVLTTAQTYRDEGSSACSCHCKGCLAAVLGARAWRCPPEACHRGKKCV